MSRCVLVAVASVIVFLSGCGSQSKPAIINRASYNFQDGRYEVVIESREPGAPSARSHFADDGKGAGKELVEITWGVGVELRIEDRKLTVNGKDRGTLAKGDRIQVDADGGVWVNGHGR